MRKCLNLKNKREKLQNKVIPSTCNIKFYKFRIKYLQNGMIKVNEIFSRYY